ncbi:MAG TPA: hypothetical protein PKC08_07145 [Pseudomonadales bacterium]|nr:hypothetical protein [Pseudomonadales bacterium]
MRQTLLIFTTILALLPASGMHARTSSDDCVRLERQREQIVQQLRRPHSVNQANRLHARLREVRSRIAHGCR